MVSVITACSVSLATKMSAIGNGRGNDGSENANFRSLGQVFSPESDFRYGGVFSSLAGLQRVRFRNYSFMDTPVSFMDTPVLSGFR